MTRVGVVGAGVMGTGLTQNLTEHGHEVVLTDRSKEALDRARAEIERGRGLRPLPAEVVGFRDAKALLMPFGPVEGVAPGADIRIIDTTIRDGQQSLWALNMRTGVMLTALERLDRAGYEAIEFIVPAAQIKKSLRDLNEDIFQWLRLGVKRASRTQLRLPRGCCRSGGRSGYRARCPSGCHFGHRSRPQPQRCP